MINGSLNLRSHQQSSSSNPSLNVIPPPPPRTNKLGYIVLVLLLSVIVAIIISISLPFQINTIRIAYEDGLGLAGVVVIGIIIVGVTVSFSVIISASLILCNKYKLNIFISLIIALIFSCIASIGPAYMPLSFIGRAVEQTNQKKEFDVTFSKIDTRLSEVNTKVRNDAMAGPAFFRYKYEYEVDLMVANNTGQTFPVEIFSQFRLRESTATDSSRLFHGYDDPNTPYKLFQPLKTTLTPGNNAIPIKLPIYFNKNSSLDFSNGVDTYIRITSEFETLFPPREIKNKISQELLFKTNLENWNEIHKKQINFEENGENTYSTDSSMYSKELETYSRPEGFRIGYPRGSKPQEINENTFSLEYQIENSATTVVFEILGTGKEEDIGQYIPPDATVRATRINSRFQGYEYYLNKDQSDLTDIVIIKGYILKISHAISRKDNEPINPEVLSLSLSYFKYLFAFIFEISE